MAERDVGLANYILQSIHKDLTFLRDQHYVSAQTYDSVVAQLPQHVDAKQSSPSSTPAFVKPPLPTRKSTTTLNSREPVAPSREQLFPKLPVRRSGEDRQPSPQPHHSPLPTPAPAPAPPVAAVAVLPPPTTTYTPPASAALPHQALGRAVQSFVTPPVVETPPPAYTSDPGVLATAEALYDYSGDDPSTDLSFRQGQTIQVTEYVNDDWWRGTLNGKSGIFPQNHVKKRPNPPATLAKAKRAVPPPAVKAATLPPSQSTSNVPYSYPPPPTAIYHNPPPATNIYHNPPPATTMITSAYPVPGTVQQQQQQQQPQAPEEENKVSNMAKKFGGHVATAATWGFGATLGSEAAHAIF
ncbi:hypothetical protein J3Q64DRAFT_1768139 [Phycomyces blakesleeanus]|uniref:SH3 domain-containing protein n=2 Tax=Phycomyces blakesleeanus TaxID=4837 RepID=A0A167JES7_PHYB8|nr:hypothetical protein PHYBLDRAFT_80127 [Phycomyces blakesleeanus NRRL 1555(-)]OAD65856.1 hypothetical protein PHYBLDRAFT_80127 [Phycomyces blakesleeanus NRRL 1555(-)]|eukprot:XP_018283896.1 hypothetical protein PHYBLDRAFT_80127 [Phycomyces blakesleeanus NRRL 1555(-)]